MTREEIEAAARTIHARNGFVPWERVTELAREAYRSDAKAMLEAVEQVREATRLKNCKHERKHGVGAIGALGCFIEWACDDCGKVWCESADKHEGFD